MCRIQELFGYFAAGGKQRYFWENAAGIDLIRGELSPKRKKSGTIKALRFFRRAGVRRLLNGEDWVERYGFFVVETGSLYRANAGEIALAVLHQRGLTPRKAVVGIRGNRWTRDMERCCERLAGEVKTLSVALPEDIQDDIVWDLQRKYGLSVPSGDGDLTLCFSPAESGENRLLLGEKRPSVDGLFLGKNEFSLPDDAAEGLAAVLSGL